MTKVVIDTNVLLVANEQHTDVSPDCIVTCTQRLLDIQKSDTVIIDDEFRIIGEYLHKTEPNQSKPNRPKGVGDVFLKWLLRNQGNSRHVESVHITEAATDHFAEFPDQSLQPVFDAPDRKFPAVANGHPDKPAILQAADCKWLDWSPALKHKGIKIEFLCPDDVCRFYGKKFPGKAVPDLP